MVALILSYLGMGSMSELFAWFAGIAVVIAFVIFLAWHSSGRPSNYSDKDKGWPLWLLLILSIWDL